MINEIEQKRIDNFVEKHLSCQKSSKSFNNIEGQVTKYDLHITQYSFYADIEIECPYCHEKENITDTDNF